VYVYECVFTSAHMYMRKHIYICIIIYICTCIRAFMDIFSYWSNICMFTTAGCIHSHKDIWFKSLVISWCILLTSWCCTNHVLVFSSEYMPNWIQTLGGGGVIYCCTWNKCIWMRIQLSYVYIFVRLIMHAGVKTLHICVNNRV